MNSPLKVMILSQIQLRLEMKNLGFLSIFIGLATILLSACNAKQSAAQCLKDDAQRKEVLVGIVYNQAYRTEMMKEMMASDSSKLMMSQSMMNDVKMQPMMMEHMMSMCKNDSTMCKMMMNKTMEMCDAEAAKCDMLMKSMEPHPNVMKAMNAKCDMKGMGKMDMMPKK